MWDICSLGTLHSHKLKIGLHVNYIMNYQADLCNSFYANYMVYHHHCYRRHLHQYHYFMRKFSIFLVQVRLRTDIPCTPSSIRLGFELMTSRSWRYTSCHWDACSNHYHTEPTTRTRTVQESFCLADQISHQDLQRIGKRSLMQVLRYTKSLSPSGKFELLIALQC